MRIESIKLSPKKGGNGYTSSFSLSIGSKEAAACGLVGERIIKIIDEENSSIIIRAKQFTLKKEIIDKVIQLKREEQTEADRIDAQYALGGSRTFSSETMVQIFSDEMDGKIERPREKKLQNYLQSLPVEVLADLVLLMYIGRDFDVKMEIEAGTERFLDFYDFYSYIVTGLNTEELVDILMEKDPLPKYLRTGIMLLNAPKDSDIDELLYGPQDKQNDWN